MHQVGRLLFDNQPIVSNVINYEGSVICAISYLKFTSSCNFYFPLPLPLLLLDPNAEICQTDDQGIHKSQIR